MSSAAFFLESTYQEAYDLLVESRDYIETRVPEVRRHASHAYKMVISVETMRLTTRLYLEELTPQQAAKHAYRLGAQKICLDRGRVDYEILPIQLRKLLERSHVLYTRIHRMDQQLAAAD